MDLSRKGLLMISYRGCVDFAVRFWSGAGKQPRPAFLEYIILMHAFLRKETRLLLLPIRCASGQKQVRIWPHAVIYLNLNLTARYTQPEKQWWVALNAVWKPSDVPASGAICGGCAI